MAGILDKKSRIFDYIITSNGKKQIQKNDIRYKFATLSDRSIVYNKDYDKLNTLLENVSNSEYFYLPFESSYKTNVEINDEFSFEEEYTKTFNINNQDNLTINNQDFDKFVLMNIENNLTGIKLKNLSNLLTKNLLFENQTLDFKIQEINSFDFKNLKNVERYNSIAKYSESCSRIKPVSLDDRFKHKNNFKKLLPFDSVTNNEIFERSLFNNLNSGNSNNIILKSLTKNLNIENLNREQIINKVVNHIENSDQFIGKKYLLKDQTDFDSFFIEMHEITNVSDSSIDFTKLSIIDMGDIFDNIKNISKRIFLIGKLIKTKNSSNDSFEDLVFKNNNGILDKNSTNNILFLGNYYSFINMFTLIID